MQVLAFALVVVFASGVVCLPEEQITAVKSCLKENNILYGIYRTCTEKGFHGLSVNPGKEVKCGLKCILTALKMLTESGMLEETIIKQNANFIGKLDNDLATDWSSRVQKCMDPSLYPVDDECTATWSMLQCVENVKIEMFPAIVKSIAEIINNIQNSIS
ncbi:hypothetical protein R5R35_002988 [Gryllus longicercus]|uniref:Odorant binding protein n=1 Tax=Gryllus longicercus TaxID=2509291 RepID=A0AAN9VZ34_9ORTH